ncbi:hypothetical protein P43SY_004669 [Pythium insidiosum]|uniref:Uncharacterized protein n=1 Tax=Pythium insidiosum TaxID=114742 RepID=A0AAD5Q891_PYTIN|nr:hypothetical protein P43SY_004669 [Pythium insidiosum]
MSPTDAFDGAAAYLVMPPEAEQLIEELRVQELDAIGLDARWISHHHAIEKLNLQAHQSAQRKQDNFVVELLLTHDQFPTLIRNLLAVELWKAQVFPLLRCQDSDTASLRIYYILYHEAALVNLLEVAFFHEHVLETLDDDLVVEVVDYCMRKLSWLLGLPRDALDAQTTFHKSGADVVQMLQAQTPRDELARQRLELDFRVAVQSVTLLRYVAERLHLLSLSVVARLLDTHDALLTLVALVEHPPWTHKGEAPDGSGVQWRKFSHQRWAVVAPSELLALTTTEAQVWLAIYYLLCTRSAREHYEITTFRQQQLLRLRKYLHELLLDQLPLLADVQRYLDELAIARPPAGATAAGAKSSLVLEALPQVRESMLRAFRRSFGAIAGAFDAASAAFRRADDLRELAELYQLDGIDELLDRLDTDAAGGAASESNQHEHERERERDDDELVEPTRVTLVFRPSEQQQKEKKKKKSRPLIVDVTDQEQQQEEEEKEKEDEGGELVVRGDVDLLSQRLMESKTHRYYRYALRVSSRAPAACVPADCCVDASVELAAVAGSNDRSSCAETTTLALRCDDLQLPRAAPDGAKLWRQIGSLQDDACRVVVQCQFVRQRDRFRVGALFLAVPL